MNSTLTRNQKKQFGPVKLGRDYIVAEVRHDDQCGNGHNSFAITADIYGPEYQRGEASITMDGKKYYMYAGGCCHDEVKQAFPELAQFIRWHLSSTDGPMHYVANALYWAGHKGYRYGKKDSPPNLEHLKSTIIFGALETDRDFDLLDCLYSDARGFTWNEANAKKLEEWLKTRIDGLQAEFRADVEKLGFTW